jgi:hypothetical protein
MSKRANLEEIEKSVDFESVAQKLDNLSASGGLKRRKKVSDLLDKVKPALLRARENKVSLQSLTEYLVSSGIPVSEATLRHYLNLEKKGQKRRTQPPRQPSTQPAFSSSANSAAPAPVSETSTKKLPPRLARRESKSL